jgi:adenine-specific DNA-methyltransferase
MSKLEEAQEILASLGLPRAQRNERSCLTLLALAGLGEADPWKRTQRPMLRIVDIMAWMQEKFGKAYAPNSRETVRRQTIHQFEAARLVNRNPDNPARPTNSGDTNYQLTEDAATVLASYGTSRFKSRCAGFIREHGSLSEAYGKARTLHRVPVTLPNGSKIELSPGKHNELQRLVIEEFAPRFAPGSVLTYLGDTENKRLYLDSAILSRLHIPEMKHDKLPDVVLYDPTRNWLFLIEAVTSHGPVSPKRHAELENALNSADCGRVYVTAFLDFSGFRKYAGDIVWESEVWIAEAPDHMIHYDGERFLGPYRVD